MRIHLAADHAGFLLKERIKEVLMKAGHAVLDHGAFSLDKKDDYPDFINQAAEAISKNPADKAIILGGSGEGEAMAANRFKNVRAAVYYGGDDKIITLSREHNNANVLALGARFLTEREALHAVKTWLATAFSDDARHKRRINKF
ncbi:MAG: RpiB/LacA/LacB family sugar-phosphate isomerase [bacterium]|nr:RpiB/LacA/LacB family sugar-phosphate isomerase [bacterium]